MGSTEHLDMNATIDQRLTYINTLQDVVFPSIANRTTLSRLDRAAKFDKSVKQHTPWSVGTKVMLLDQTCESKWDPVYEGQFIINRLTTNGAYELMDVNGTILPRKAAPHMIKPIASDEPGILEGG